LVHPWTSVSEIQSIKDTILAFDLTTCAKSANHGEMLQLQV